MEEINRNTRTLIVSFTIAILAMIPLRFVEVGNSLEMLQSGSAVLGESVEEVEARNNPLDLESPYNLIDAVEIEAEVMEVCLSEVDARVMIEEIESEVAGEVDEDIRAGYLNEIRLVEESICQ